MVAYVGDIDRHVLAQLALERNRPILVTGHGVCPGIHTHGVSAIRYVGLQLGWQDDRACRPSARNTEPSDLGRACAGPVEIECRESPVGSIRHYGIGLVAVHWVGIP